MVCLLQVIFILWSNLICQFVLLCCTLHCILSGSSRHILINPSTLSSCSLNINCYFIDSPCFPFVSSKQQDNLSYLQLSTLIDKYSVERYKSVLERQRINCDSFQFEMEALHETKVNIINVLFDIIFDSFLNFICLKFY